MEGAATSERSPLKHDRALEPGEVPAQAEMPAVAECDVAVWVAIEDPLLGILEGGRVD